MSTLATGATVLVREDAHVMAMNARTDDAQEGMCAFLEKRPATWRGS